MIDHLSFEIKKDEWSGLTLSMKTICDSQVIVRNK